MKRSRIFLGVTTALLAIAGVAATNAHRIPKAIVFTYTKIAANPLLQTCPIQLLTRCSQNSLSTQTCFYHQEGGVRRMPVYTSINTITWVCLVKAKYLPN